MIKSVNIRLLKDKLSAHLRDVQQGDIVLVSDRGRIVAEIRTPLMNAYVADEAAPKEQRLAEQGVLRLGMPNDARAYQTPDVKLSAATVDRALDETRGRRK